MRWGAMAAAAIAVATAVQAAPGDPMVQLLGMRPISDPAIVVELRDPDGEALWPVNGEIQFEGAPAKRITLGEHGLRFPLGKARPVAIRLDPGRWGAPPVRYPIDIEGGVRITLRYVPGD